MEELNSQSSFDRLIDNTTNPPEGLPDGIYTYPGIDALYKKENGQWFKKVGGSSYVQLKDGNVAERIKKLESDAIPVPKEKEEIQKFTNIQDFDVIQPAQQYRDVFEPQNNLLVKPKKEEKPKDVRIVDNNGIKTWQEEKERKVQQKIDPKTGIPMGPSYFTVYEDITDPTRVSNLNKSYKEDASTSKDQKVFTGYPGKPGTEYVLNEDNLWEVKRPGSDDFLIVSTPESVTALNNYFKQSADVFDDNKAIEIKNKNKQTLDLRYRINKVDRKLILGTEENAQEVLQNLFPEYEFEQFGVGTDNIRVKSKSNEIEISLDNWSNESDETEALRLRSFLRENAGDIDESRYKAVMLQRKLDAQNKKYYGTFGFSGLQTVLETGKPKELGLKEKTEEAREEFLIDLSSQYKDTYLRTKDKSEKEKNAAFASLKPKEEEISIINKYADDVLGQSNSLAKQQKQVVTDISILESNYKNGLIDEDEYNKSITDINDKLKLINDESKSLQNNLKNVSLSQDLVNKSIAANLLIQKNKGSFVGGVAYSAVDGILSIPRMIAMADKETKDKWIKEIVGVGTTDAYINSEDRWDITKAAFQMSRSLSAMAVGSIGGTYGAYASLYAMSYYEMKDELDQLDISGVSEGDKVLMSAAYGLVGGALENFGLSYLVGKSPLKSSISNAILKNAFSQIPKNASKEMVEAQVMKSTKMMIAKYGITALGSSVLEGGVEGTQRLAQMGIQEVYDVMKGSNYFNNKSAYEVLGDVAYESYMGFLGGGIVETVQQSGNVLRDGSAAFKDKKQLNLLIEAAKTMGIDKALVSKLKSDILNGNIKKEEAEKQLNSFKEIQGKIKSIPDNMSVENQAQALDLILERDRLNKEIEGKDPNLVKPQSDRITEINNNLQELSKQNAVQEPSTEGVLQREQEGVTETGGERGGVEPIVQGEEVTKEGEATTKEEVISVYHGGDLTQQEGNLYVSEDANQARSYAKENQGDVTKFEIPKSKIADEQTIKNTLKENNIEVSDEAKLYEVIDPRFEETYIGDEAKNKLIDALQQKGFDAAQFTDEDIEGLKKEGVQNIIVFKPESLQQKSIEVKQNRADELFLEGYKPIINGEVKTEFTQQELDDYFDTNQTIEMTQITTESDIDNTPKFQKEPKTEQEFEQQIEGIKSEMNEMPDEISNFDVPSNLTTKNKTNVKSIISRFGDKLKKAWKGGIIKNVTDYSGIPMIFTISDQLGAGKVKNPFTNSTIDINGGINFNLTEGNENNAWANTTKEEAEKMLSRAQEIYGKNKDLFDRLWKEGKLPNGQIPMAIIKMGQESIQTNEALFGFASETIKKKFNKTERTNSLNGLIKDIESFDPKSKVLKFIQENNYKTIDELLDNVNKLKLGERAIITRFLFTGGIELNKETKPGKPKSNSGLALVGNRDSSYYKYIHLNTINNIIQDESTKEIPPNHIIGITGVDVLNPEITKPNHRNYPYGVKGGLIGIIESPVHAADVFPEMYSKSFYLNKENKSGKLPSVGQVISQTVASSGAVTSTKAFRGAKLSTKMTDLQKLLGKLKLAFPSVTIVDTQEEFEKELNKPEVKKFIKDGDIVYGFTKDGKIFLNPEKANSNTAIHEFSHLWMEFLKKNNPNLLKKGYSLLEGTYILKEKIKEFGDNELAREEAMAELIANKGETLIEAGKKSKFKNWLNAVFNYVKSKFKSFDKLSPEQFQNITLNEFVDGSLKSLLKGEEITTEEIKGAGIKFQKQSKEDAIQDANDIHEKSFKRFKDDKRAIANAVNNLEKSKWYRDADDMQREEAVREIRKFFGEKLKAAPSIAKVTGKTKQTAFVSDLAAAIRDQVKLQARSSRETAKNINDRRKALGVAIKDVVKEYKGKITERQLNAINRKIANVNLFNQEMVERVIDYVNKVMNNAEYATKVNNAFAERRAIRRMMKSGNMADTVAVAKEFTQIDPSMVDDIDTYLEMAQKIRAAVKSSKRVKDSVSLKEIVNFGEAYEYINPILKSQEESMKNMLLAEYNDLAEAGVISKDMTLKDINNIIKNIRAAKDEEVTAEQEETAREFLKQRLESIKSIISMVSKGYNPLTGEVMEISDRNKQMIAKVVKSDMNNMSTKQLIEMVDSLSNFVENGAVSGIEAAYETYIGEENAASLDREGVVAKTIKLYASKKIGGLQAFSFMSLPELFNRMFGGVKNGINVMTKMGFSDIILGANKARKLVEQIQKRYVDKFGDVKGFFDNENIYERGALAFLTRNVIGSEAEIKSEFNRRVDWLFESFERLKIGTAEEQKMAVVYGKIIDKLDIKSRDLEKIYSNADKTNVEAVNWWIEEWSKHYSDLSDVSRSVYNAILGKDTGYTTDRLKMTSKESLNKTTSKDLMDLMERNSSFLINTDAITNTNESGVMIASIRPEVKNTKGRYVSLDFEINNIDSLTGALVDINTAGAIRRLDSFMKSKSFDKIIPNSDDQIILKTRINRYVRRIKNKMPVSSRFMRDFNKIVNTAASLGATLGLGGATQVIKQTVSVAMSTALQTKGNFNIYAGKSFNDWLDTTGASVANRGQESISSIESANKKIQSFSGNFDRTLKALSKATQWQLRLFLSRPDIFVARAAFKSYYEQFLKENGYDVSRINWDTWSDTIKKEGIEKLNRDAIVYADTMVSRQQNVSDERLAGEALASEDDWVKFLRKVAFPFGSFSINQRARLINDLITIKNRKTASKEDVAIAWSSLFGTLVEQSIFQAINLSLGMLWYAAAQGIAGHDDDEEEWEKRKERATQYPFRSLAADVTSPNPLFDDLFIDFYDVILSNMAAPSESEINKAINDEEKLRESLKKDPMTESQINEFKKQYIEDNTYQLSPNYINFEDGKWGMFSIAPDQAMQLYERFKTVSTGTVISDDYGKETTKYLTDKDKRIAQGIFYSLDLPYTAGAGIKEMGQVSNKTYSIIKNRALTENQYETYKQFKKDFKREPQEWEINLIKSTKSANDALGEFDFIKEQGGLSPKQGVEYLNVFKKIGPLNPEDYRMIINGKKADQVIKSILK